MSRMRALIEQVRYSNEAVSYQDGSLHSALTSELTKFRKEVGDKVDADSILNYRFHEIIRKYTGMNVVMNVDMSADYENAYVLIPSININSRMNSPIFNRYYMAYQNHDLQADLNQKDILESTIDRKKGIVDGWYSKVIIPVYITKGMFTMKDSDSRDYLFTTEEISAVILHELGHAFSFFEAISTTLHRNWILETHLNDWKRADTEVEKVKIIHKLKAKKIIGQEVDEQEIIALNNRTNEHMVIVSHAIKENQSDIKTILHDYTSFESAADQFAARHGGGDAIVSGLSKIYKKYRSDSFSYYLSKTLANIADIFLITIFHVGILVPVIGWLVSLSIYAGYFMDTFIKMYNPYDKPKDRFKRIENEIIGRLKNANLPKHMKEQSLKDIEAIRKSIKENEKYLTQDSWTIGNTFFAYIIPFLHVNKKSKEYQQLQESLVNNVLYEDAARFDTL